MNMMRVAALALGLWALASVALTEDVDVQALRARLASQEARLADLQAKMAASRPDGERRDGITSLRKNAVVTIGGTLNTRYLYQKGTVKTSLDLVDPDYGYHVIRGVLPGGRRKWEDFSFGDMRVQDAKIDIKIDVSDNVDAFVRLDLHDATRRNTPDDARDGYRTYVSGIAQHYWLRWKNICNSGFGVLVGRDHIPFGDDQPIGQLDSWVKDTEAQFADLFGSSQLPSWIDEWGNGMFSYGNLLPAHTMTNWDRTTQLTPYWESRDGRFKAEFSLFQSVDRIDGMTSARDKRHYSIQGKSFYRSINMGLGSMAARATWKPIEGLKLVVSGINHYNRLHWGATSIRINADNTFSYHLPTTSNNTAVNASFRWRPVFANRLELFGQYTHGWNEAWVQDLDSDIGLFGFSYDFTDRWTLFAMGEYLRTVNGNTGILDGIGPPAGAFYKGIGWNVYTGIIFRLFDGAELEVGWRHEEVKIKGREGTVFTGTHTKVKGDTIYANLGFEF